MNDIKEYLLLPIVLIATLVSRWKDGQRTNHHGILSSAGVCPVELKMSNLKLWYLVTALPIVVSTYIGEYGIVLAAIGCERPDKTSLICNDIPEDIPDGIYNVEIVVNPTSSLVINNTHFSSENWSAVRTLNITNTQHFSEVILGDRCFTASKKLQELGLHFKTFLRFSKNALAGLDHVKTLDMTECSRIDWTNFLQALNGSDKLPNLNKLILSRWKNYYSVPTLDEKFGEVLQDKKIATIDISMSQVQVVNMNLLSRFQQLKVFNASYAILNYIYLQHNISPADLKHIKMFDIAHTIIPKTATALDIPGRLMCSNRYISGFSVHNINLLFTPETVNISNIIGQHTSVWIENCTVEMIKNLQCHVKTLILKQNNLQRLNVEFICEKIMFFSVEMVDLSDNQMEFLHPTLLSCMPYLLKVDLSKNQLFKMVIENITMSESLFWGLKYLTAVILSDNKLHFIPTKLFQENSLIEVIDLSNNNLEQVTFMLNNLDELKVLDLTGNKIHILNSVAMNHLDSIIPSNQSKNIVFLKTNPISCSKCVSKAFLQWLLLTNVLDTASQNLKCSDENGKLRKINNGILKMVQKVCVRKTIIISTSVSTVVAGLFFATCLMIIYKRIRLRKKMLNRRNVVEHLRQGDDQFQFAAFLVFSQNDEDFVKTYIFNQLNENLRLLTGADRDLVCTGDRDFRPGFYVHNEIHRLLNNATVLIAVVSNNFCTSNFCRDEIEQAIMNRKPILQIFIEHVDLDLLTPTMEELFKRNVRVLFAVENGVPVLKTSWENVCTSLLDLIQYNNQ